MTSPSRHVVLAPEVVGALATLAGLDIALEDLPALAEVLRDQARLVEPLIELEVTEMDSLPKFDPRWEDSGRALRG
jgi:hypothetical protein